MANGFDRHYLIAFMSTLMVSVGLLITSFILPPKGVIDPSALKGVAEIMMWPALALGAKSIEIWKMGKEKDE